MNTETKTCQNCKEQFVIEPEDFVFYERIRVPAPTFCPECREQRRIAFRNERALYRRKCDLCGETVVSRVSPDKRHPMYCKTCWWSDKWDTFTHGREYDFSQPFFEQFKTLLFSTPHISLFSSNVVNSDWVNQETDDKNCYLNVGGHYNEDSAYSTYAIHCKDVFDNYWLLNSELCYENVSCERCYQVHLSQDCFDSQNLSLCFDCKNCSHCFGCAGLRNKQYWIFNEPSTKEEYQVFLDENFLGSHSTLRRMKDKAREVWQRTPRRERWIIQSENATGNFIKEAKNVANAWCAEKVEDSKHLYLAFALKDSYDLSAVGWGELMYEGSSSGGIYDSKFFVFIIGGGANVEQMSSSNLEYCYATVSCRDCFGCANLRNKQYCILNKRYTEEEYKVLVPKIKAHMAEVPYFGENGRVYRYGEFFPIELSPYAYNETAAQDHFPLTRDEALRLGYAWSDYDPETKHVFSDYQIPDDIRDVRDDILTRVLKCEESQKAFRLIPMELTFYRKAGLPIPRRAPLVRHYDRFLRLLPWRLFERKCMCEGATDDKRLTTNNMYRNVTRHFHGEGPCLKAIQTSYAPGRPEVVYCEECYQSEIA